MLRVNREPWQGELSVAVFGTTAAGRPFRSVKPIEVEVMDSDDPALREVVQPIATMTAEQAQLLMDDLYRCGIRPSEGAPTQHSFEIQEKHLSDMRSIVSQTLNVKLD